MKDIQAQSGARRIRLFPLESRGLAFADGPSGISATISLRVGGSGRSPSGGWATLRGIGSGAHGQPAGKLAERIFAALILVSVAALWFSRS